MIRQAAVTLLLCLSVACASGPRPVIQPIPVHPIAIGINDGWHGVLPAIVFQQDCPHMIRSPQISGPALAAFLTAAPCDVLALIEAPDLALVDAFARERPPALELGNELELRPWDYTPAQYALWIRNAASILKAADYQGVVVLGGVYAITDETKQAIQLGRSACIDVGLTCIVAVHLYDASEDDLQWLRDLDWPIWVTEFGIPTRCDPARLALQKTWLAQQLARFSTVPKLERAFPYQRVDGPTCSDLDTFGIEHKPAMELLQ